MTRLLTLCALTAALVLVPELEAPAALVGSLVAFVAAARIGRAL